MDVHENAEKTDEIHVVSAVRSFDLHFEIVVFFSITPLICRSCKQSKNAESHLAGAIVPSTMPLDRRVSGSNF